MHVDERQRRLADNLMRIEEPGQTLKKAIMDAGYSERTANNGWDGVSNRVVKLLAKKGIRLRELGRIDAETQREIVRGRLVYNTIKGSDKGVLSAKALGSESRVNMFVPDTQVGVIVLNSPAAALENKSALLGEESDNPSSK